MSAKSEVTSGALGVGPVSGLIAALLIFGAAPWAVLAQEVPSPPRALLEQHIRASQWEQQQQQIRQETEIVRMRTELVRAQQELRKLSGAEQAPEDLPGVVVIFSRGDNRVAILGHAGGVQWPVQGGDVLPTGHRVERIQSGGVTVAKGEGRNLRRTELRPMTPPEDASAQSVPGVIQPNQPPSMPGFAPLQPFPAAPGMMPPMVPQATR